MNKRIKTEPVIPDTDIIPAVGGQSTDIRRRWLVPLLAISIFIIALTPRLIGITSFSICGDELAAKDCGPMLERLKSWDINSEGWGGVTTVPPFSQYIYGLLPQIFLGENPGDPDSLLGARVLGALMACMVVVMTFFVGKEILPLSGAVIAALLLSFIPTVLGHDRVALHDVHSRLMIMVSWWFILKWYKERRFLHLAGSAIFAGLGLATYYRPGIQNGMAVAVWLTLAMMMSAFSFREIVKVLSKYGFIAAVAFILSTYILCPFIWLRPWIILQWLNNSFGMATHAVAIEYWFGEIQMTPWYYYFVMICVCIPPLTLIAFAGWNINVIRKFSSNPVGLSIFCFFWIYVISASTGLRQNMLHYLQIAMPALSLGAAAGLWSFKLWLGRKLPRNTAVTAGWGIILLVVGMEGFACWSVRPYFMEYYNIFSGGGASVTANHRFTQTTYGDAINPLFEYLDKHGRRPSTVLCKLGPWPGIFTMQKRLGSDFPLQGQQQVDPLGAKYILRAGIERDNMFYRYDPDPEIYEKKMDVMAGTLSVGDVWERRDSLARNGLIYYDDFSSPQMSRFVTGARNINLNLFSAGRLYSLKPGEPAGIMFRIPPELLGNGKKFILELDLKMKHGDGRVMAGVTPEKLDEVGRYAYQTGTLKSREFTISSQTNLLIFLEWISSYAWKGNAAKFWEADCVDSMKVYSVK